MMHPFQEAFLRTNSNSDKLEHHGYHRAYPWFLAHLREKPVALLEIGIDAGESLKLWRSYFNELTLYGIDRDSKHDKDKSIRIFQVDQSKESELQAFSEQVGIQFDIILDDGSHIPTHQIFTLAHFWKLLKPGGIYIIEDIETSFWKKSALYGYEFNSDKEGQNLIRSLREAPNFVNSEFLTDSHRNSLSNHPLAAVLFDVEITSFAHNCVILVKKDPASFSKYYNRPYRYRELINILNIFRRIYDFLLRKFISK